MLEFLKDINVVLTPITLILVILVLIKLNKKIRPFTNSEEAYKC